MCWTLPAAKGATLWRTTAPSRHELEEYSSELHKKNEIIVANKMDLPDSEAGLELLREFMPEKKIFPISELQRKA